MDDLFSLALLVGFFALALGLLKVCTLLVDTDDEPDAPDGGDARTADPARPIPAEAVR